jgi:hypothetical protein
MQFCSPGYRQWPAWQLKISGRRGRAWGGNRVHPQPGQKRLRLSRKSILLIFPPKYRFGVVFQTDGKIVAAELTGTGAGDDSHGDDGDDFALTRYGANGSLEPTFHSGG